MGGGGHLAVIASTALALAACATTPLTPAQCAQKQAELANYQAALPGLQLALQAAQASGANPKAVADAEAALQLATDLIAADQAYVTSRCSGPAR